MIFPQDLKISEQPQARAPLSPGKELCSYLESVRYNSLNSTQSGVSEPLSFTAFSEQSSPSDWGPNICGVSSCLHSCRFSSLHSNRDQVQWFPGPLSFSEKKKEDFDESFHIRFSASQSFLSGSTSVFLGFACVTELNHLLVSPSKNSLCSLEYNESRTLFEWCAW